jgi:hypothetical protein
MYPNLKTSRHVAKASVCLLVTVGGIVSISPVMAQDTTLAPANATVLDNIIVKLPNWLRFGGKGKSDTGTTTLEGALISNKVTGLGDANSILRNLPNVQYQNDSDNDAGVDGQDMINLRPQELSISGAKVYENNFILNGIGINNVTGSQDPFGGTLGTYENTPNISEVFGLHSQTVFVPADFLDDVNVMDSNVSARYGQFQGGVVEYTLAKPKTDKVTGSVSYGFESDSTTSYVLGTKDGLNPQNNAPPEFYRYKTSATVNVPITDNWAVIGQYSRSGADTNKVKDYRYYGLEAEEFTENNFYRLASRHDTDFGVFTLEGSYTDYEQEWDGYFYRDTQIMSQSKGLTSQLRWENDLDAIVFEPLGIENVKVDARAYFNKSRTVNDGGANETLYRTVWARSAVSNTNPATWFYSTDPSLLSWCRVPLSSALTGTSQLCREGGYGNKEQGQEDKGFKADIDGDFLAGTFSTGFDYRKIDAYRAADEYTLYSSNYTRLNLAAPITTFTCAAGDIACSYEQYTRIKTVTPAYHNKASINAFDGYAEVDQTWDWLNVRAGVHVSYEDYFGNLNFAPRLTATVSPTEDLSITGGFNRYYNANSLYYAIRDGIPQAQAYTRSHDATTGVVNPWGNPTAVGRLYSFKGADLDTPYNDEFTAAVKWNDAWLDGDLRVRYVYRQGKDQYQKSSASTTLNSILTNEGESSYHSASIEYGKTWALQNANMETVRLSGSLTWAKSKTTANGYFDDPTDTRIWYNDQSYSLGDFAVAQGNMDIPIRTSLDLVTTWFDDKFTFGVSGNMNLPFDGVRSTDTGCTPSTSATATCKLPAGSEGLGMLHEIYEDFRFRTAVTVDLNANYRAYESKYGSLDLEMKVQNAFNETGNRTATATQPWIPGRMVWLGAKATF